MIFFRGGCEAAAPGVADGEKSSDAAEHWGVGGEGGCCRPTAAWRRPQLPTVAPCCPLRLCQPGIHLLPPAAPSHTLHQAQLLHQAGGEEGGVEVEGLRWKV